MRPGEAPADQARDTDEDNTKRARLLSQPFLRVRPIILPEVAMNVVRCIPVILSTLVLGAHFYRSGNMIVVAILALLPLILLVRKPWVPGFYAGILLLGAAEWVRTLLQIAELRQAQGAPWTRMAIIVGVVALVTASSSLVFTAKAMRTRYRL
jgi:hypothetical protein